MGILDGFEKLINEHGSAAILKERIALANDKYSFLEEKNTLLKRENEAMKKEKENHEYWGNGDTSSFSDKTGSVPI